MHRCRCSSAMLFLGLVLMAGCTQSPGESDPQPQTLVAMRIAGACLSSPDQIEVSVILEGLATQAMLPEDTVKPTGETLNGLIEPANFGWQAPDATWPNTAMLEGELSIPADLQVNAVEFVANADGREQLVVLAIDNSGSLIGELSDEPSVPSPELASDFDDQRIIFLSTLVQQMAEQIFLSVVRFKDVQTQFEAQGPTRDRDLTYETLMKAERGAGGRTPLALVLRDIQTHIISPHSDMHASVVLVTDGVEGGDPTDDAQRTELERVIAAYSEAEVPVFVLQLQPPEATGNLQGRDPKLVELACRTGGEHFMIEAPREFRDPGSNLSKLVRNRLQGAWKVRSSLTPTVDLAPDAYFLSSQLILELGPLAFAARLIESDDPQTVFNDQRLWFVNPAQDASKSQRSPRAAASAD